MVITLLNIFVSIFSTEFAGFFYTLVSLGFFFSLFHR